MKKIVLITFTIISILSCKYNSTEKLSKEELCNSTFQESHKMSDYITIKTTSILNCDGTFKSDWRIENDAFANAGYNSNPNYPDNLTGTWEVVSVYNEEIKEKIREFGKEDTDKNYTVIKINPNGKPSQYMIYYQLEGYETKCLSYLPSNWGNIDNYGELGLWTGNKVEQE